MAVLEERGNVASSHTWEGGQVVAVPTRNYDALGPAGSVFSTAHDMAQWVRLHLNHGTYDGRRLLDSATIAEMHTPQMVIGIDSVRHRMFPSNHFRAYGLAWRLEDYHGRKIVQHTGSVNFTRTQVGFIPEEDIGFVAFANITSSELQTALMYRVFDALLGIPKTDWSGLYLELERRSAEQSDARAARAAASRIEGTRPSLQLADYAGTYTDSLYGEVEVRLEESGLVLDYSPDYVADLEHWHLDTFRAAWRNAGYGHSMVTFHLDLQGRVAELELEGFSTFDRTRDQ
jgi:CubicO group peptidase (beta-lactamase class C family)